MDQKNQPKSLHKPKMLHMFRGSLTSAFKLSYLPAGKAEGAPSSFISRGETQKLDQLIREPPEQEQIQTVTAPIPSSYFPPIVHNSLPLLMSGLAPRAYTLSGSVNTAGDKHELKCHSRNHHGTKHVPGSRCCQRNQLRYKTRRVQVFIG